MKQDAALLVIDMQCELLQRNVFQKEALIKNVNLLLGAFHASSRPVFLIRHHNDSFLKENTDGWQLSPLMHTAACTDALKLGYGTTLAYDAHSTFHKEAPKLIPEWNTRLSAAGAWVVAAEKCL